jgi:hypothetical protein
MTLEKAATARTGEAPVHNQLFVIIAISLAVDFFYLIQPLLGSAVIFFK